jgi:hypothetical protein
LGLLLFLVPLAALALYLYGELLRYFSGLPPRLAESSRDIATYRMAGEAIVSGQLPYRDFFIEYPPGSLPFFVPPALFSETDLGYAVYFASEMALILVLTLVLTAYTARAWGRFWPLPTAVFAAGILLLYPVAVARYDAVVALSLAAAVCLVALGSVGSAGRWALVAASVPLGIGAAAKLVPALAMPALVLLSRNRRAFVLAGVTFGVAVGLFFVPAYLLGPQGFAESFSYHADRGVQMESVASSLLMRLGLIDEVLFRYGAHEVWGYGTRFWASMSLPVTGALLILTGAVALRERLEGRFGPAQFPRYAAALVLAFIIGSKVLSPQYMIWLLPLVPLAARGYWGLSVSAIFLAACWTTTQVFPFHYEALYRGEADAINILLGRNILLVVLWGLMLALPHGGRPEQEPVTEGAG